jgi:transcriptional regulator with XRE-family HTH domain
MGLTWGDLTAEHDAGEAGGLVRAARMMTGLSQRELARRCGVHAGEISLIEAAKRQPTFPVLLRILRGAGFELRCDLVSGDGHDGSLVDLYEALTGQGRRDVEEREQATESAWRTARRLGPVRR